MDCTIVWFLSFHYYPRDSVKRVYVHYSDPRKNVSVTFYPFECQVLTLCGESWCKDISRYMQAQKVKIDASRHKGREHDAHIDINSI